VQRKQGAFHQIFRASHLVVPGRGYRILDIKPGTFA
jgi:hypothetical protein